MTKEQVMNLGIDEVVAEKVVAISKVDMSNLKAFLNENAIKRENVKVVVSDRFVNEKNQPVEWELHVLDNAQ